MGDANSPLLSGESSITIIGVGLIGGSIAAALKKRGYSGRICGAGRNPARLQQAVAAGLLDECTTQPAEAAAQSGLILVCTPVDLIVRGIRDVAPSCRPGTLISDVGSTKGTICRELSGGLTEDVTYIGSHPLAGSEKQGFEQADADLFEDRVCVVTPHAGTPADQLARLKDFWQALGCRVIEMSPEEHDLALARTSHLPHVAAAALALLVDGSLQNLAAGGFADTTRIAAGDPDLWKSILLANAEELTRSIDLFTGKLAEFREAVAKGDAASLKNLLQLAKTNRDSLN